MGAWYEVFNVTDILMSLDALAASPGVVANPSWHSQ